MPWEWATAPEFWLEWLDIYFSASAEVAPVLERKRLRALGIE